MTSEPARASGRLRYDTRRPTPRRSGQSDAWHLTQGLAVFPHSWIDGVTFGLAVALGALIVGAAITTPRVGGNVIGLFGVLAIGVFQFGLSWAQLRRGYSGRDRAMLLFGEVFIVAAVLSLSVFGVRALAHA